MAFCRNCGKEVKEDAKFCGGCGATREPAAGAPVITSGIDLDVVEFDVMPKKTRAPASGAPVRTSNSWKRAELPVDIIIMLVLYFIGCPIIGGFTGYYSAGQSDEGAIVGAFGGFLVGTFISLFLGWILRLFAQMGADISALRKDIRDIKKISSGSN